VTERQGLFSIPTRLLLAPEQRAKLETIVRARAVDLSELLSEIVADYLDAQPDVGASASTAPDAATELRKRRAELAGLRARRDAAGAGAPAWLNGYVVALEEEIRRLESSNREVK
jgi:hypothetical protein